MKYILGGGLAGLVTAFYNPEYKLVSPKLGGIFSQRFNGPKYLHVNIPTEELLKDLKLSRAIAEETSIGYWSSNKLADQTSAEGGQRYSLASRGINQDSATLCSGSRLIISYRQSPEGLVGALRRVIHQRGQWIGQSLIKLSPLKRRILLDSGECLIYRRMINTLPIRDVFKRALGRIYVDGNFHIKYRGFRVFPAPSRESFKKFGIVYFIPSEDDLEFLTNGNVLTLRGYKEQSDYVYEYVANHSLADQGFLNPYTVAEWKEGAEEPLGPGIINIGRAAQGSHKIRLKEIILSAKGVAEDEKR